MGMEIFIVYIGNIFVEIRFRLKRFFFYLFVNARKLIRIIAKN